MAAGAYELHKVDSDGCFSLKPVVEDLPEDQMELRAEVDRTLFVLQQLRSDSSANIQEYIRHLRTIAEIGLTGAVAQTVVAAKSLVQLKEEIVEADGQIIKNRYAHVLGWYAGFNAIGAVLVYAGLKLSFVSQGLGAVLREAGMTQVDMTSLRSYAIAWCGAMAGGWISFVWRSADISFSELTRVRPSWRTAQIRLLFTGMQTVLVGLLMHLDVLSFKLGSLDTSRFADNALVALAVGAVCGCSEQALPLILAGKSDGKGGPGLLGAILNKFKGPEVKIDQRVTATPDANPH